MRLLIIGMQSSGASLLAYLLAQRPDSLAMTDVWPSSVCPRLLTDRDILAKCVVSLAHSLEEHEASFRPDATLLCVRDPATNYANLSRHDYRDDGGPIDDKFRLLERYFADRERFTRLVAYEDVVARSPALLDELAGVWPIRPEYFDFRREKREVARSCLHLCDDGTEWGFGNVHGRRIDPEMASPVVDPDLARKVGLLCPTLSAHYRAREPAAALGDPAPTASGERPVTAE